MEVRIEKIFLYPNETQQDRKFKKVYCRPDKKLVKSNKSISRKKNWPKIELGKSLKLPKI